MLKTGTFSNNRKSAKAVLCGIDPLVWMKKFVQRFAPEHLPLEDTAKVACGGVERVLERRLARGAGLELEAGDLAVGDAARDDPIEVAKIGGDVESEAVRRDALRDMDADGGDFFLLNAASGNRPDAGSPGDALCHHAEVAAGTDEDFFEQTNIIHWTKMGTFFAGQIAAQIDDRVADELARAMVGDIAASIDLVQFDAALLQKLVRGEDVGTAGIAAESEDWGVFKQEEGVADEILFARDDYLLLDGEAFRERDAAEMKEMDEHATKASHGTVRW